MSKQQTAVEWLLENMPEDYMASIPYELAEQATQMEREQIVDSYSNGWHDGQDEIINRIAHIDKGGDEAGLKHFNDTYGK